MVQTKWSKPSMASASKPTVTTVLAPFACPSCSVPMSLGLAGSEGKMTCASMTCSDTRVFRVPKFELTEA